MGTSKEKFREISEIPKNSQKNFPRKFPEKWDAFTIKYTITEQKSVFLCL